MQVIRRYGALLGTAGLVVALDQWTKWLVRKNLPLQSTWLPESLEWLNPYARIVHWHNSGAAVGMFQDAGIVFTVLAFIVIAAIFYYYPRVEPSDGSLRLAMGLQLGGALGNLVDRLTMGKVTDFLSVGTFPVFNVADASISMGVVVLLLSVWLKERADRRPVGENPEVSRLSADR